MNDIEKQLMEGKERIHSIQAPEELEKTLSDALQSTPTKGRRKRSLIWKVAVAAIILFSVIGYNYNALAYYSKKIMGFDDMLFSNIKDLNDNEMGQVIDKSIQLKSGTTLTINGMMTDENQLILFYTLTNPNGIDEGVDDHISFSNITGFLTRASPIGGGGKPSDDGTEIKWMQSFEPVNPFAKKLTLHIWEFTEDNEDVITEISFAHDPNKAMRATISEKINETIKVDQGTITFKSITASPTLTVIEGAIDVENYDRFDLPLDGIKLIANGNTIGRSGSGSTTAPSGVTFDIRYDALPTEIDTLQLELREFTGYDDIDKKIKIVSSKKDLIHLHEAEEMFIKNVEETSLGIEITIATDENVTLEGVSIETEEGEKVPLETTINQDYSMQFNGQVMKERTIVFDTKEAPAYLLIEGIHYIKPYHKTINIPIK